jgi:hypothetical protein
MLGGKTREDVGFTFIGLNEAAGRRRIEPDDRRGYLILCDAATIGAAA